MNSESPEHLAPENFVDVIEGAPVEVSLRLHVEHCEACQGELEELRRTLALVRSAEELGGTDAAVGERGALAPRRGRRSLPGLARTG